MTSNKEDYLKVLYEYSGTGKLVPNKLIAQKLKISAASVSEMLTKLNQQGLIAYEAYKGSRLTEKGLIACQDIIRSHRLWEVFLVRHLGYTWREAHEDAHLLEHITPAHMADRLNAFLDYPRVCPHGSSIPQEGAAPDQAVRVRLSDLSQGDTAIILYVIEDSELLDYLESKTLKIREVIQITSIDDYEGPVAFLQNNEKIGISFKAATQVYVKRLNTI